MAWWCYLGTAWWGCDDDDRAPIRCVEPHERGGESIMLDKYRYARTAKARRNWEKTVMQGARRGETRRPKKEITMYETAVSGRLFKSGLDQGPAAGWAGLGDG